jgi:hypothetical protein
VKTTESCHEGQVLQRNLFDEVFAQVFVRARDARMPGPDRGLGRLPLGAGRDDVPQADGQPALLFQRGGAGHDRSEEPCEHVMGQRCADQCGREVHRGGVEFRGGRVDNGRIDLRQPVVDGGVYAHALVDLPRLFDPHRQGSIDVLPAAISPSREVGVPVSVARDDAERVALVQEAAAAARVRADHQFHARQRRRSPDPGLPRLSRSRGSV